MNRRNLMLGLAAGPVAATSVAFAQGNSAGAGGSGANLIAQLFDATGTAIGTFAIQRFAVINNQLNAIGAATLAHPPTPGNSVTSTLVTTLAQPVTSATSISSVVTSAATSAAPTADPPASCPILHLDIAPISLNLLGLQITTSEIVLDIAAIPGAGNLLGNLLCSITGLLNPGGTLTTALNQISGLLNQLLSAL